MAVTFSPPIWWAPATWDWATRDLIFRQSVIQDILHIIHENQMLLNADRDLLGWADERSRNLF